MALRSQQEQASAEGAAVSEEPAEAEELPEFISNDAVSYWVHPAKESNIWLVGTIHQTAASAKVSLPFCCFPYTNSSDEITRPRSWRPLSKHAFLFPAAAIGSIRMPALPTQTSPLHEQYKQFNFVRMRFCDGGFNPRPESRLLFLGCMHARRELASICIEGVVLRCGAAQRSC